MHMALNQLTSLWGLHTYVDILLQKKVSDKVDGGVA